MSIIDTPCPYCAAPQMPAPARHGALVRVKCPACGKSAVAVFSDVMGQPVRVHYVRAGRPRGKRVASVTLTLPLDVAAWVADNRQIAEIAVLDKFKSMIK